MRFRGNLVSQGLLSVDPHYLALTKVKLRVKLTPTIWSSYARRKRCPERGVNGVQPGRRRESRRHTAVYVAPRCGVSVAVSSAWSWSVSRGVRRVDPSSVACYSHSGFLGTRVMGLRSFVS